VTVPISDPTAKLRTNVTTTEIVMSVEAMRRHCVNLMRIQHGAEAQDEPYEKLAKAIPVSELALLRTTFCPMERQAMFEAAQVIVRFFREHAPRVAATHGADYPVALAHLMSERLDGLGISRT
jgi:hypothetical protein